VNAAKLVIMSEKNKKVPYSISVSPKLRKSLQKLKALLILNKKDDNISSLLNPIIKEVVEKEIQNLDNV